MKHIHRQFNDRSEKFTHRVSIQQIKRLNTAMVSGHHTTTLFHIHTKNSGLQKMASSLPGFSSFCCVKPGTDMNSLHGQGE